MSRKTERDREHQQIEWRRNKVIELTAVGHSQREIANILQVGSGTVARDQLWLKAQAESNITDYTQRLAEGYQHALAGLTAVIKRAWRDANDATNSRDRINALNTVKETLALRFDLITDSSIVEAAMSYIEDNSSLPPPAAHNEDNVNLINKQQTNQQLQPEEAKISHAETEPEDSTIQRAEAEIDREIEAIDRRMDKTQAQAPISKPVKIKRFVVDNQDTEPLDLHSSMSDVQQREQAEIERRIYKPLHDTLDIDNRNRKRLDLR